VAALCSVKDGFSSKGKTLIFDCSPEPNPVTNQHQTGKINYVGEFYRCANVHYNQLRSGALTYWWNITPMCIFIIYMCIYIFLFFFRRSTARTKHPIIYFNARWLKRRGLVLLGVRMMTIYLLGVCSPKNCQYFGVSREIPAKTRLLKNILTVRNTPIVVIYY